jgi:hypothetical protein
VIVVTAACGVELHYLAHVWNIMNMIVHETYNVTCIRNSSNAFDCFEMVICELTL